ncbi:MAG: hypothetical protein IPF90_06115 [Actinomycetales bacterium]|nr:hypothetical protein [Candidatus Phosphoribacter baldrii]
MLYPLSYEGGDAAYGPGKGRNRGSHCVSPPDARANPHPPLASPPRRRPAGRKPGRPGGIPAGRLDL